MSTTKTKTVQTAYGDVEVELVECDSCGNEVRKADTDPFTIGDGRLKTDGVACKHCVENGPIDFPSKKLMDSVGFGEDPEGDSFWNVFIHTPIWIPLVIISQLNPDHDIDRHHVGYAWAWMHMFIWAIIGLGLWRLIL